MLSDPTQPEALRRSSHWNSPLLDFRLRVPQGTGALSLGGGGREGPAYRSNSLSGHERNRLFLQDRGGEGFRDVTLISGLDSQLDARSFAFLDYDRDGWTDIALMSVGSPRFQLFRNQLGAAPGTTAPRVITLRLAGANRTDTPGRTSNRDAVGALVKVETSLGRRLIRRGAGEGLASQNSSAIPIALRPGERLRAIEVAWPSGAVSRLDPEFPEGRARIEIEVLENAGDGGDPAR